MKALFCTKFCLGHKNSWMTLEQTLTLSALGGRLLPQSCLEIAGTYSGSHRSQRLAHTETQTFSQEHYINSLREGANERTQLFCSIQSYWVSPLLNIANFSSFQYSSSLIIISATIF